MDVLPSTKTAKTEDFDVSCTWSFLQHHTENPPGDGIGGTLKRLVSKASQQRLFQDQILSFKDVFESCQREVQGIQVFFISCHQMGECSPYSPK